MSEVVNADAADTIVDLHKGLHVAMDALIRDKDYAEAELVLRQMDERFSRLRREMETSQ